MKCQLLFWCTVWTCVRVEHFSDIWKLVILPSCIWGFVLWSAAVWFCNSRFRLFFSMGNPSEDWRVGGRGMVAVTREGFSMLRLLIEEIHMLTGKCKDWLQPILIASYNSWSSTCAAAIHVITSNHPRNGLNQGKASCTLSNPWLNPHSRPDVDFGRRGAAASDIMTSCLFLLRSSYPQVTSKNVRHGNPVTEFAQRWADAKST